MSDQVIVQNQTGVPQEVVIFQQPSEGFPVASQVGNPPPYGGCVIPLPAGPCLTAVVGFPVQPGMKLNPADFATRPMSIAPGQTAVVTDSGGGLAMMIE